MSGSSKATSCGFSGIRCGYLEAEEAGFWAEGFKVRAPRVKALAGLGFIWARIALWAQSARASTQQPGTNSAAQRDRQWQLQLLDLTCRLKKALEA